MSDKSLPVCERLENLRKELHRLTRFKHLRHKSQTFREKCNTLTMQYNRFNRTGKTLDSGFYARIHELEEDLEPLLDACLQEEIKRFRYTVRCRAKKIKTD